ncbi:MAG: transglutaminase-like domain-containing protein [Fimbriimonas sp.]|nr:transglutaminase-like domain-containing protein [Fimbriimonas sp.]
MNRIEVARLALTWIALGASFGAMAWGGTSDDSTRYFGVWIHGQRVGYESLIVRTDMFDGEPSIVKQDHNEVALTVSGETYRIVSDLSYRLNLNGRPKLIKFSRKGPGSKSSIEVTLGATSAMLQAETEGSRSTKTLPLPEGAIIEDPYSLLVAGPTAAPVGVAFFFDPETSQFQKLELSAKMPSSVVLGGVRTMATLVHVKAPNATLEAYYASDGELLKLEYGTLDTVLSPTPKEEALAQAKKGRTSINLDELMQIRADAPILDAEKLSELKLSVKGSDLSSVPSDSGQTISRDGDGFIVDIHPRRLTASAAKFGDARKGIVDVKWLRPAEFIPSDSAEFKALASKLTAGSQTVVQAAIAIRDYVHQIMRPDMARIDPTDARDLLKSKRGMCGNFAILTTTILRAAGIPTRIVSGLETVDGAFYGHYWCEIWDGAEWFGIDSTVDEQQLSAAHLKLAEGMGKEAYDRYVKFGTPTIKVLSATRD